ncbi:MAG: hypothetical protein ACE5NM_13485 [Sedimentisphaerales bacterium]
MWKVQICKFAKKLLGLPVISKGCFELVIETAKIKSSALFAAAVFQLGIVNWPVESALLTQTRLNQRRRLAE